MFIILVIFIYIYYYGKLRYFLDIKRLYKYVTNIPMKNI